MLLHLSLILNLKRTLKSSLLGIACPQAIADLGAINFVLPHETFSSSRFFHLIRYFEITHPLNFFSCTTMVVSRINYSFPSSSSGGNLVEVVTCPTTFFRQDTWKTLWILLSLGSSNSYATSLILSRIL